MLSDLLNIFYPKICCTCQTPLSRNEDIICTKCRIDLPKATFDSYSNNEVDKRFWGKIQIKYAFAYLYFYKSGITQKLLHQLKYKNQPEIGTMVGNWLGADMVRFGLADYFDVIIPVPLSVRKERKRGYNQSECFARGISEVTDIPVDSKAIIRAKALESQTNKTREERWKNVENAFQVIRTEGLMNKKVLLVDDVITTGCTLEACANQILKGGITELSIACMALAK